MTVDSLIKEIRSRIDDRADPPLFSDDDLIEWLAQAEAEAAERADLLPGSVSLNVSNGIPFVAIDPAIRRIEYAELRGDDIGYVLAQRTEKQLDLSINGWRTRTQLPREFVHRQDGSLRLSAIPDRDYTLYLDYYAVPEDRIADLSDTPTINEEHHLPLIHWVLHIAFLRPDAETFDPAKSAMAEVEFTRYFGRKLSADHRRRVRANRPHANKAQL